MKTVFIMIFLAALLASCGPSHPLNYARIEFRDSGKGDFLMLSIIDLSLHAKKLPWFIEPDTSTEQIIPFQNIHRIFLQGDPSTAESLGFLSGTAIGIGYVFLRYAPLDDGLEGIVSIPFIRVGWLTGHIIGNALHEIDIYSPQGQDQLRKNIEASKEIK